MASFIYVPNEQLSSTCINNQGQTKVKRIIAFRDKPPYGEGSGMPCGACREFLLELDAENRHLEFMVDYESRKTITLGELILLVGEKNGLVREKIKGMSRGNKLMDNVIDVSIPVAQVIDQHPRYWICWWSCALNP